MPQEAAPPEDGHHDVNLLACQIITKHNFVMGGVPKMYVPRVPNDLDTLLAGRVFSTVQDS